VDAVDAVDAVEEVLEVDGDEDTAEAGFGD
jgi:hypothetical protein